MNDGPMTDDQLAAILKPCPFCGAGETRLDEGRHPPRMNGPGALISVTVRHWCKRQPAPRGAHTRMITFTGRDHETAINAWNARTE